MSNFSKVLEEFRQKKQILKQDLADRAGLTASYVSHLTLGSRDNPSIEAVTQLANALALDSEEQKRLFDAAGLPSPVQPIAANPSSSNLPVVAMQPAGDIITQDWDDAPNVQSLFGREDELKILTHWILQDCCQLVIVSGSGGIGKTTLATRLARDIADEFDYVFWHSLKDAPTFESILEQFLSNQQLLPSHASVDERIHLFMDTLKTRRCLLVLDNMESILQEKEYAGEYRDQYEEYGRLIDAIGGTQHKSCLVLTTREVPKETARLAGETAPVRVYSLKGLKVKDGLKILEDKELHWLTQVPDAEKLVTLYAGNPLALKVAAEFIRDAFAGDIAAFLASGTSIFQDIQSMLEQQFQRLTSFEQQIMYWLAIEREAVSAKDLRNEFASAPGKQVLADAFQSLRRRSLIDIHQSAYVLQPVILEFITEKLVTRAVEEIGNESIELINSHALLKAQAKDYNRDTQSRLILDPIAKRLVDAYGREVCESKFKAILHKLHEALSQQPGYAAGNILNLLIRLGYDLNGYDFSHLYVWQVYLQGVSLNDVNFSHAHLEGSIFTDTFTSILAVAISPDNRLLAAGTENGEVRLWDANSGALLRTYQGHTGRVRSVAFSPKGNKIVSGSEDYTLRIWSTDTNQCLYVLRGHTDRVRAIAISPDSATIISGSDDCSVRIWDLQTGHLLSILEEHTDRVRAVAFSLDEKNIASAGEDHTIRLWDVDTGKRLKTLTGHEKQVHAVNFSPDGKWLASAGEDHTIRLWDVDTGRWLKTLVGHTNQVRSVAFNPAGDMLVSSSDDTSIRLWDVQSGQCLKILQGHLHRVYSVNFSLDGSIIISGSEDQTVRLWASPSGQSLKTLQGYINQVRSVAFHPEGNLLVSGGDDQQLRLWNVQAGQYLRALQGHTNGIRCVAFNNDGEKLASCSDDRTIRLWNTHTGKCLKVLQEHTDRVRTIAFSHDGTLLASGGEDQTVRIWDVTTGQCLKILQGHTDWVRTVAFSPDGTRLASGGEDYTVRIWEVESGQNLKTQEGHRNGVRCVSFSPDGGMLASSGDDETIRLWNTATWENFSTLQDEIRAEWILSIAFSPDGTLLASGSEDQKVRLWDVKTGKCLKRMPGHAHRIYSVAFHPDGQILASGSLDGTIKLWDVAGGNCITTLRNNKPYEGMNLIDTAGLTDTQKIILKDLGAITEE